MSEGSQYHYMGCKRVQDCDADMHTTRLVADVDEFADLDEKYQDTLDMEINQKFRIDYCNRIVQIVKYFKQKTVTMKLA